MLATLALSALSISLVLLHSHAAGTILPTAPGDNLEPEGSTSPGKATLDAGAMITVTKTVIGKTTRYIGAQEGISFYIEDLTDLGINTYRMWVAMNELERCDDDDGVDRSCDNNRYGIPTIAKIKADEANGFENTIPWIWWDLWFRYEKEWRKGTRACEETIRQCVDNGISPLLVLQTKTPKGEPSWAPAPPIDEAGLNEWWEYCFAIAYWLNVRNNYGVTHFDVWNEPDRDTGPWTQMGGIEAEYVQLVKAAYDAIKYANDMVGLPTYIHAPVAAHHWSPYVSYCLTYADEEIELVDYHTYVDEPLMSILNIKNTISMSDKDRVLEPIWISEWGTSSSTYNDFDRAMLTAKQLLTFSEEEVEGVNIYTMYDRGGSTSGLIDVDQNENKTFSETYYAYRLMTRALIGAKERLAFTTAGLNDDVMVTREAGDLYIIVFNGNGTVTVDVSALGLPNSQATVYEYSKVYKDKKVATATISDGRFSFVAPASGISLAIINPQFDVLIRVFLPIILK